MRAEMDDLMAYTLRLTVHGKVTTTGDFQSKRAAYIEAKLLVAKMVEGRSVIPWKRGNVVHGYTAKGSGSPVIEVVDMLPKTLKQPKTRKNSSIDDAWCATDPEAIRHDVQRMGLNKAAAYNARLARERAQEDARWRGVTVKGLKSAMSRKNPLKPVTMNPRHLWQLRPLGGLAHWKAGPFSSLIEAKRHAKDHDLDRGPWEKAWDGVSLVGENCKIEPWKDTSCVKTRENSRLKSGQVSLFSNPAKPFTVRIGKRTLSCRVEPFGSWFVVEVTSPNGDTGYLGGDALGSSWVQQKLHAAPFSSSAQAREMAKVYFKNPGRTAPWWMSRA